MTRPEASYCIICRDLRFSYGTSVEPVISIDLLEVSQGERLLVHGRSGSGKSTLLGLLSGVLAPSAGTMEILGRRIDTLRPAARDRLRAAHMGYIFQMLNLLPYLSAEENVTLPLRFSRERNQRLRLRGVTGREEASRLLAALGLDDPSILARRPTSLSAGQQQRVAAARALIGSPELLIADEPTSSLDAEARDGFLDLLLGECRREGTTVVFVSHDRDLERHFTRSVPFDELNRPAASTGNAGTKCPP